MNILLYAWKIIILKARKKSEIWQKKKERETL